MAGRSEPVEARPPAIATVRAVHWDLCILHFTKEYRNAIGKLYLLLFAKFDAGIHPPVLKSALQTGKV